jgi:carboxymethylenebutenolidase
MVFQEAFGVNTHIRDVANRLAALGYLAAAPELYHRTAPGFEGDYTNFNTATPHMRALTTEGLDDDIRATHSWLTEQGCERIVAVGFCMGGRVAARAAAAVPLAAAASFYGGGLNTLEDLVPRVGAPLLLVWGDRDTHIPLEVRTGFANALRAHKKSFVECTFSDAGHGFFCDQRASYHAPSAHLAWSLLTAFLAEPAG